MSMIQHVKFVVLMFGVLCYNFSMYTAGAVHQVATTTSHTQSLEKNDLSSLQGKKPKKGKTEKPKTAKEKKPKKGKEKKPAAAKKEEPKITIDVEYNKKMMDEVYQDISGFGTLKPCEENKIVDGGGAPTYGEITYDSLQQLIEDLNLGSQDVFVDLGSGVGKVTLQMALNTPVKQAIGIELADTRYEGARKALDRFVDKKLLKKGRVQFRNENMLETNIKNATVVYTCSTCFSQELMKGIAHMLSKLKPGLRFLTLKKIPNPEEYGFTLKKEYLLPMTWAANGNAVYFYELEG